MDISKIEQGKLLLKEEEFEIDSLESELNALMIPVATSKNIIMSISSKDVINKSVIGDYSHTLQVMINLATNAIKYTPQGGFVKIRFSRIHSAAFTFCSTKTA